MIRRLSAALLGTTLMASHGVAQDLAQSVPQGLYVGGAVGHSTFWDVNNIEFDLLAFMFAGNVGYRFHPNIRGEGEILYEFADINGSSADANVLRFLGTVYYDFNAVNLMGANGIRPYVGAGAGIANVEIGRFNNTEFDLHGDLGLSVPIAEKLEFVPGLRLSYSTLDGNGDDLVVTNIRAGVRYSF